MAGAIARSEIRLVRNGDLGVRSGVPLDAFGTDKFPPFVQGAPERQGCGPGHRESACILNCELDLQALAFIVGIGPWSATGIVALRMLSRGPFYCFHRRLIIKQPITFHKVQGLGVRRAEPVDQTGRS